MNRAILFAELKRVMKIKKLRYRDLSQKIGLAESSIKRIFSTTNCTLEQLEDICQIVGISLADLLELEHSRAIESFQLSEIQEHFFSKHFEEFLFYRQLVIDRDLKTAVKHRGLTMKSARRFLKTLEQQDLIKVMLHDRIKFVRSGYLQLRKNGVLMKTLHQRWLPLFLSKALNDPISGFDIKMSSTQVSKESMEIFFKEYQTICANLRRQSRREKTTGDIPMEDVTLALISGPVRIGAKL